MAAGVHAHGANQVAAGHGSVLNQGGTDCSAEEGSEHGAGCGCSRIVDHRGAGVNLPRRGSDRLQVAVAAGIADQAAQGEAQQVGGGDHLCQVSSEGGGGIEPVGTVAVALEDHLHSGAVDLNVGDGAALLSGEGAEDRSGGGHGVRCRLLWNCSRWRGGRSTPP